MDSNIKLIISNDSVQAMFSHLDIPVMLVEEPQIAGVTDEDIKDDTKPVEFEEIQDENDIERDVDQVVEGVEDLTAE